MTKQIARSLLLLFSGIVALWPASAASQQAAPVQRIAAPVDAATLAVADLNSLDSVSQTFTRYIWIPPWVSNGYAITGQFLNEVVSRNSVIVPPHLIDRAGVTLVRVDLRRYAPNPADQQDIAAVWDKLESVYFPFKQATLDTFNQLSNTGNNQLRSPKVNVTLWDTRNHRRVVYTCTAYKQRYNEKRKREEVLISHPNFPPSKSKVWVSAQYCTFMPVDDLTAGQRVATLQNLQLSHLGNLASLLPELTDSEVPIIRLDVLIRQAYTSLDTDRFDGLYYEFTGIDGFALDDLLDFLGADPRDTNLTRIPVIQSQVTGKPRVVDYLYGTEVRPGAGAPLISITSEVESEQRGITWQKDVEGFLAVALAHELIYTRRNGTNGYAIFADQVLLDSVPDNIASNHKIRPPFDSRLFAGLACVYCHSAPDRTMGYVRAHNDFLDMLLESREFNSFLEAQQQLGVGTADQVNNIRALQLAAGNMQQYLKTQAVNNTLNNDFTQIENIVAQFGSYDYTPVLDAQRAYARAIRLATHTDVQVAAHASISLWNNYEYRLVDSYTALRDLGFVAPKGVPSAVAWRKVLGTPLGYEDPLFSSLKIGKPIDRGTWEATFPLAAQRTANSLMLK